MGSETEKGGARDTTAGRQTEQTAYLLVPGNLVCTSQGFGTPGNGNLLSAIPQKLQQPRACGCPLLTPPLPPVVVKGGAGRATSVRLNGPRRAARVREYAQRDGDEGKASVIETETRCVWRLLFRQSEPWTKEAEQGDRQTDGSASCRCFSAVPTLARPPACCASVHDAASLCVRGRAVRQRVDVLQPLEEALALQRLRQQPASLILLLEE